MEENTKAEISEMFENFLAKRQAYAPADENDKITVELVEVTEEDPMGILKFTINDRSIYILAGKKRDSEDNPGKWNFMVSVPALMKLVPKDTLWLDHLCLVQAAHVNNLSLITRDYWVSLPNNRPVFANLDRDKPSTDGDDLLGKYHHYVFRDNFTEERFLDITSYSAVYDLDLVVVPAMYRHLMDCTACDPPIIQVKMERARQFGGISTFLRTFMEWLVFGDDATEFVPLHDVTCQARELLMQSVNKPRLPAYTEEPCTGSEMLAMIRQQLKFIVTEAIAGAYQENWSDGLAIGIKQVVISNFVYALAASGHPDIAKISPFGQQATDANNVIFRIPEPEKCYGGDYLSSVVSLPYLPDNDADIIRIWNSVVWWVRTVLFWTSEENVRMLAYIGPLTNFSEFRREISDCPMAETVRNLMMTKTERMRMVQYGYGVSHRLRLILARDLDLNTKIFDSGFPDQIEAILKEYNTGGHETLKAAHAAIQTTNLSE